MTYDRPTVGFLQPEATFTHLAAIAHFGRDAIFEPMESEAICQAVHQGEIEYGVLPIENLLEGTVGATLDFVGARDGINVVAEVFLPIHHHLLTKTTLEQVTRIYSHPQALSQCRRSIQRLSEELGREIEVIEESSTARGAQIAAASEDPGAAALANAVAAMYYRLKVVRENMEDGSENATRFWVLGHNETPGTTGGDKTTILFDIENQPGALVKVLTMFSSRGLNATMLQSRPSRLDQREGLWEYTFIVEYLGHITDTGLAEAFAEVEAGLGTICKRIRLLGSYPRSSMAD